MKPATRHGHALAAAIAATFAAEGAGAATTNLYLVAVREHVKGAYTSANISSSTATWSYDDVTGLLSQTGGVFNARFTIVATTTLFRHTSTGLVIGTGGAAIATSYACLEGNFGGNVGASLCGNYNFGANFTNESSASWGPGTAVSRTIGGDDGALGPQQSVATYDGFETFSWDGATLVIGNAECNPSVPGSANSCGGGSYPAGYNTGYSFVLQTTVPVPAAAWLFGGALGALAGIRRVQSPRKSERSSSC